MLSDIHRGFLRDRINEIGSALFFNTSSTAFKLPTSSIISAMKMDEQGNIWFFLHKPAVFITEADKQFPARLDFYRKGMPFFLQVSGKALAFTEEAEIEAMVNMAPQIKEYALNRVMLVKVQVTHAEYFEQTKRPVRKLESWWHSLCSLVFHQKPVLRPYKLHPMVFS